MKKNKETCRKEIKSFVALTYRLTGKKKHTKTN